MNSAIQVQSPVPPVTPPSLSFTNSTLVSGLLTFTHNLNTSAVPVTVFDDSGKAVLADYYPSTSNSLNATTVDLTTFGTITGTWTVKAGYGTVTPTAVNVGAVSRVVVDGTSSVIPDKYSLALNDYVDVLGTGILDVQGDACVSIN